MNYLLLGDDDIAKEKAIGEIKKEYLPSLESKNFDYEVLYASDVDPVQLKKSLLTLPVVSPQRIVILREVQKLKSSHQIIIFDFLHVQEKRIILILDSLETELNNDFIQKITKYVKVQLFQQKVKRSVFDLTETISQKSKVEALKVLSDLLGEGIHPLQMIGALVWFWGKTRPRMSEQSFQGGLKILQEADLNMKRSRLKADYALELAVVKLIEIFK